MKVDPGHSRQSIFADQGFHFCPIPPNCPQFRYPVAPSITAAVEIQFQLDRESVLGDAPDGSLGLLQVSGFAGQSGVDFWSALVTQPSYGSPPEKKHDPTCDRRESGETRCGKRNKSPHAKRQLKGVVGEWDVKHRNKRGPYPVPVSRKEGQCSVRNKEQRQRGYRG